MSGAKKSTTTKTIKKILVSQARPESEKSPYFELERKHAVALHFQPLIQLVPISGKDFRKTKIDISEYTAVIFTSKNAIDHFFRTCDELKVSISQDTKYFWITEQTAIYLQKYIVIRKRKIFSGQKTAADLLELIKKHKSEKFLFPCSDKRRNDIPEFMGTNDLHLTEAVMYETVSADLSDLEDVYYDILAFFSPSGIKSLFDNFPDFQQNNTRIAAFGPTTAKAVTDAGLILDIQAPLPNAPSMSGALELYIKKVNGL